VWRGAGVWRGLFCFCGGVSRALFFPPLRLVLSRGPSHTRPNTSGARKSSASVCVLPPLLLVLCRGAHLIHNHTYQAPENHQPHTGRARGTEAQGFSGIDIYLPPPPPPHLEEEEKGRARGTEAQGFSGIDTFSLLCVGGGCVCVCLCVCVCVCVCVCSYMHANIHTSYTHPCIHIYLHLRVCVCILNVNAPSMT
jgi:hypothetical protein